MSASSSSESVSRPRARAARRRRALLAAALVVLAGLWLLPAIWVALTSLKLTENIIRVPPEWLPWPATLAHYGEVLFSSSRTARIGRAFLNSVVVSVGTVVVVP
jgi:multiple sugar transport system permease protein